jgi:hypothetical protein
LNQDPDPDPQFNYLDRPFAFLQHGSTRNKKLFFLLPVLQIFKKNAAVFLSMQDNTIFLYKITTILWQDNKT